MKTYLVGGAVRDKLLGLPVKEHDWVVVGATPDELTALGYRRVGQDFPVFLHPDTKEEYALARTERKTGPGYKGFDVDFSGSITLEEDLKRRDLTVNAIAEDEDGNLIDPFGGQADLNKRILRHVSDAFVEDPVRLLRLARFLARFADLGFTIAPETGSLMTTMVKNGEIDNLVPERVWQELQKALNETRAENFFDALQQCGALERLFPQIHPEQAALAQQALIQACSLSKDAEIRFAAWLGCASENSISAICEQLRAPKSYQELALLTGKYQHFFEKSTQLPPPDILEGLQAVDAFRRPERFEKYLLAAEAVTRAKTGQPDWPHPQREYLYNASKQAMAITAKDLTKTNLSGPALAAELSKHRQAAISKIKRPYRWSKLR